MAEKKKSTSKPKQSPQKHSTSNYEKGFSPVGSSDQDTNVLFTPTGEVTPAKSVNDEKGKGGKK
jgi:hypothetical protein